MHQGNREHILGRLKSAPRMEPPARLELAPMAEASMDLEQLAARFTALVQVQTGVVHRVQDDAELLEKLAAVLTDEGVTRALASTDAVLAPLNLVQWGREQGIGVTTHRDYPDREIYKKAAFVDVEAGITGADYGFAESGTLCLVIDENMPRLPSLAPILHIAVLPLDRLKPTYGHMLREVYAAPPFPSQVVFITGPSMTADVQATPFKGMHGPRRLIVMLKG